MRLPYICTEIYCLKLHMLFTCIHTYVDHNHKPGAYMYLQFSQLLQLLVGIIYVMKLFSFILYPDKCLFLTYDSQNVRAATESSRYEVQPLSWCLKPSSRILSAHHLVYDSGHDLITLQAARSFYRCKQGPYYFHVCVFNIWYSAWHSVR